MELIWKISPIKFYKTVTISLTVKQFIYLTGSYNQFTTNLWLISGWLANTYDSLLVHTFAISSSKYTYWSRPSWVHSQSMYNEY